MTHGTEDAAAPAGRDGRQGADVELSVTVDDADRDGPPTVYLHGVGSTSEAWREVLRFGDHPGPVVRYDLRGHGRSARPPGPYRLEHLVTDHVALLDRLDIERANLVGISLGGLVAQAVALTHPETVAKLALLGAATGGTEAERSANHPAAHATASGVLAENDLADRLGEIQAPTLVLTGVDDAGAPPHLARLMADRIPDAELVVVEEVRHGILEELPQRVAAELSAFLSPARRPGDAASGMSARRAVLGTRYVDRATANDDPLSREFQDFVTRYCWGKIWTDDRLSRKEHSLLTLAMTAALGRMDEFEAHAAGALRNGITPDQFPAIAKQIAVYCGVPAGVNAIKSLRRVLETRPGQESDA